MLLNRSATQYILARSNLVLVVAAIWFSIQTESYGQLQALRNAPRVDLKPIPVNIAALKFKQQPIESTNSDPQISNRYSSRLNRGKIRRASFQEPVNSNPNSMSLNTADQGLNQLPQTKSSSLPASQKQLLATPQNNQTILVTPTSDNTARTWNSASSNQGQAIGQIVPLQEGGRSSLLQGTSQRYELTPPKAAHVEYKKKNGTVTMLARNATVADVLNVLAEKEKISFVLSGGPSQTVSFSLQNIPISQALTSILAMSGHTWKERNGIVYVTPNTQEASTALTPEFSGKIVKVFNLDYASSKNVSEVVAGMLSVSGKSYVVEADTKDNRKTDEQIVVEDFPGVIERVAQYIEQVDRPPRQVLIEAFVLEVSLGEDDKHGVNFEHIAKLSGNDIKLGTIGITPSATSTFFAEIDAPNLKGIIDALKTSNDTRTLASPKVMVVNGQESRLQVGQQLGFRVIQQNGNTSLENVKFIDVGVVLTVTPRISRDGRILMSVKPEVSSGEINVDTGLPEEETSEVDTSVLLSNGKGMVIGGLIQEKDGIIQSKVPVLGDLRGVGGLFRRTAKEKTRSEIIFVLIPRIVEHDDIHDLQNQLNEQQSLQRRQSEYIRSTTPLFECEHCPQPRPSFNPQMSPVHREYNGTNPRSDFPNRFNYGSGPVPLNQPIDQAPAIEHQHSHNQPAAYYLELEPRNSNRRQPQSNDRPLGRDTQPHRRIQRSIHD